MAPSISHALPFFFSPLFHGSRTKKEKDHLSCVVREAEEHGFCLSLERTRVTHASSLNQQIVIDGRDHLVGRLASIVAKKLLSGYKIVVVRSEGLVHSGAIYRSERKALQFRNKRTSTNPKKGPFHHRAPSRQFHRVVRGMLPHKTTRGNTAYHNLKVYEGCPSPYDTVTKLVVPQALRVLRLKPGRKWCTLGDVQKKVGWKYSEVVTRLEDTRKAKAYKQYLASKKERNTSNKAIAAANNDPSVKPFSALLAAHGY